MAHDPQGRITLTPVDARLRVRVGGAVVADTARALEMRETGYPPVYYIPREDVATDRLQPSSTTTHCPFKGDAAYYSLTLDGEAREDAAWSYEAPLPAMADIAGHLAFDERAVEIERER